MSDGLPLNHLTETILYPLGFFKAVADHRWSMKGDALPPPCQMMHNGKDCTRRAEVAVKRPALSEVRRAALRDHGGYAMRRMKKRYPPLRFVCARCDRPEIPHFGSGIPYVHVCIGVAPTDLGRVRAIDADWFWLKKKAGR